MSGSVNAATMIGALRALAVRRAAVEKAHGC
jgi:hypothetical protein